MEIWQLENQENNFFHHFEKHFNPLAKLIQKKPIWAHLDNCKKCTTM